VMDHHPRRVRAGAGAGPVVAAPLAVGLLAGANVLACGARVRARGRGLPSLGKPLGLLGGAHGRRRPLRRLVRTPRRRPGRQGGVGARAQLRRPPSCVEDFMQDVVRVPRSAAPLNLLNKKAACMRAQLYLS
jgi:hypothetical protein